MSNNNDELTNAFEQIKLNDFPNVSGSVAIPDIEKSSNPSSSEEESANLLEQIKLDDSPDGLVSTALPDVEKSSSDSSSSDSSENKSEIDEKKIITITAIQELLREKEFKNVIVCTGAGVSTSAGIPDFRSPGTGLYSNLQKYNLPYPEAVFDVKYFKKSPQAFYTLSTELLPGKYAPTITHHFIKMLQDEGILLRCYTQNIDGLEGLAGVSPDKLVEAHGSFSKSRCVFCKKEVDNNIVYPALRAGTPLECTFCKAKGHTSYVKPDIVFFGESLPKRFHDLREADMPKCDLMIVIGTSLYVYPFAALPDDVSKSCPRLLINRELVGNFKIDKRDNIRDTFYAGNADDGCLLLAESMGIKDKVVASQIKQSKSIAKDLLKTPTANPKKKVNKKKTGKKKV